MCSTSAAYPLQWAEAHAGLAEAYYQATLYPTLRELYGGRSTTQEQALTHAKTALQVLTLQTYPLEWASLQHCLGTIYYDRIAGKHSDNIEHAREAFEASLQVYSRAVFALLVGHDSGLSWRYLS